MPDLKLNDKFEKTFVLTAQVYEGFIQIFKDNNPLHTNEEFAVAHGFEGRVMHGNILNGFLSYFIGECLPQKDVIIHSQEIEFKNPVYLNDELFFEAIVAGVYESVGAVQFKFLFKNAALKTVAKGKIQIGKLK
jgi:acyl dehydratase